MFAGDVNGDGATDLVVLGRSVEGGDGGAFVFLNTSGRWTQQMPRRLVERRMLQGLADEMTAQTQVHVEVRDAVRLDDPQLLQVPFLLMTVSTPFEFTDSEAARLGAYLTSEGISMIRINTLNRCGDTLTIAGVVSRGQPRVGCGGFVRAEHLERSPQRHRR